MTIKTFTKKPETITSIQWTDTASYWDICTFLGIDLTYIGAKKLLEIPLADGKFVYAEPNDWVVKDVNGDISIIKPTDMTTKYDEVITTP